jgi:hypothetical protein
LSDWQDWEKDKYSEPNPQQERKETPTDGIFLKAQKAKDRLKKKKRKVDPASPQIDET